MTVMLGLGLEAQNLDIGVQGLGLDLELSLIA